MKPGKAALRSALLLAAVWIPACLFESLPPTGAAEPPGRETKIPASAVKMSPESDPHPPLLLSAEFEEPVPVPGAVNTAGAEDSPFILPDGNTLYFFFTPDVSVPVERQLYDGVTGIYVSRKSGGLWGEAQRIPLQDPEKIALDGCEFVQGDVMWFCTIRTGYTDLQWFTARNRGGIWRDWEPADFPAGYRVGELHLSSDGMDLYFGSDRPGGRGKLDLWMSKKAGGKWQEPVNLAPLNTPDDEGWPALSPDGTELWFYRNYGVWRAKKAHGEWGEAEQIVSTLAGEPTLDEEGNLYFVHHYFIDERMIEADIYVAYRK